MRTNSLRHILTCAPPTWADSSKTNQVTLYKVQNKVLWMITKSSWYICNKSMRKDFDIPMLDVYCRGIVETYIIPGRTRLSPEYVEGFPRPRCCWTECEPFFGAVTLWDYLLPRNFINNYPILLGTSTPCIIFFLNLLASIYAFFATPTFTYH